jgi:hypothetical protein
MPSSATKPYHLTYNPKVGCVTVTWEGDTSSQDFKEATLSLYRLLKFHQVSKVLADIRYMKPVTPEDQQWFRNEFLPLALRDGIRICAFIYSVEIFTWLFATAAAHEVDDQLHFQFFHSPRDAEEWLVQVG